MDAIDVVEVHLEALSGTSMRVVSLLARERIFTLPSVEVSVLLDVPPPDLDELLGESVSLVMRTTTGSERAWHGIVWSARVASWSTLGFRLDITVSPGLRRLTLGKDSRMFREMSVRAIIDDVLRRGGISEESWTWRLADALPTHVNVIQHGESDWDFCTRLLAEEGVTFVVNHDTTHEELIFLDSPSAYREVDGVPLIHYRRDSLRDLDGVFEVREALRVASNQVRLRDYDARRSHQPWDAQVDAEGGGDEVYLHPGGFHSRQRGASRSARYLDSLRSDRRVLHCRGDVPFLEPGRRAYIDGHDRVDLNEELVIAAVTHRAERPDEGVEQFSFECTFEAVPATIPLRPRPPTARRERGLQRAFVTAPLALEHISDGAGRVKVRFPWDRSGIVDAESSTWCRVGQLQLPAPMVLPRVAMPVYVESEQGDWDRHLVTGHRYNAEQLVPYPNPASAAISSWQSATLYGGPGTNEIRFDDTAGTEEVLFHASMHLRAQIDHDAVRRVTNDEEVMVGVRQALAVRQDHVSVVGGDRNLAVGRNQDVRVDESLSESVGHDKQLLTDRHRRQIGGDLVESVRGSLTRTVGPLEVSGVFGSYVLRVLGDSVTRAGTFWAEQISGDRVSHVRGNRIETIDALKLMEVGSFRLNVAGTYQESFDELSVEVEGDRSDAARGALTWRADSELKVTAQNVSVTATDSLTLCAGSCTITLASSGTVTLQAPRVNLRNARSLGSTVQAN